MSILSDIADPFVDLGNAISGVGSDIANTVAATAISVGSNAWNYAVVAGNGVASAGEVVGKGVVSFGNDVQRFSISAGGTAFNWLKTSAYDVERWSKDGAGVVAKFAVVAYEQARDGVVAAWNFIKDLISANLPVLDEPSAFARDLAIFVLGAGALGYEQMARRGGMTIGLTLKAQAGVLFNLSYPLGIYVDREGSWGFQKLVSWEQFKDLRTGSLSLSAGVSLTVSMTVVFGGRSRFSDKRYLNVGAEAKFGAFSVGGKVLVESGDLSFLGFELSAGVGLSLEPSSGTPGTPPPPPKPSFSVSGQSISVSALLEKVGDGGAVFDAAVRTAQNPGQAASICAAAAAASMSPFSPRFYGYLRLPAYGNKLLVQAGQSLQPAAAPTPGAIACLRLVAGLADPAYISVEGLGSDGYPWYICIRSDGASFERYDGTEAQKAAATLVLEQGLADSQGISLRTRATPPRYLTVTNVMGDMVMPGPGLWSVLADSSAVFRQRSTFRLDPQPLPANQTAVLQKGETLGLNDWRRSPDGRYFMRISSTVGISILCGTGPADIRPAPALGSPGTGFLSFSLNRPAGAVSDPTLALTILSSGNAFFFVGGDPSIAASRRGEQGILGSPGDYFIAVTDGGRIVVFQGYPDRPAELLASSNFGQVNWAKARKQVAIQGPSGQFVKYVPMTADAQGKLRWDSSSFSGFETFELSTLFDDRVALRSLSGWFVSAPWDPRMPPGIELTALLVNGESSGPLQAFTITPLAGGAVSLRSSKGGRLWRADASGLIAADGLDGDPQTRFTLIPLERNLATENGRPFSITAKHSGKRLTVFGGSLAVAQPVAQLTETGGRSQAFTLLSTGDGLYSFAAQHSGQQLEVNQGSTAAGAGLVQSPASGAGSQKFKLLPNDDGTYCIIAAHSGLALDVPGSNTAEGTQLIQWPRSGSPNQRFYIRPEVPLVTRALVAAPTTGWPMQALYQERIGQSDWLDGWLDSTDLRFSGDFLGIGRAQLLCINRSSSSGGRVMLADFGSRSETGRALYYEAWNENASLNGWTDSNDRQHVGDFLGRGRPQLLLANASWTAGRLALLELTAFGPVWSFVEMYGKSPLFNGWQDDNDWWLSGDLMGKGREQLLCVNRTPGGGKVMVVDFGTGTPTVLFWESWGQSTWLDGWLDDQIRHFIGDFLGRGRAQWLMVDRRTNRMQIADLSSGTAQVVFSTASAPTAGFVDEGDAQVVGDFLGLGRMQLLCVNRQPWANGKLMILEFQPTGTPVVRYWEMWGQRTCFDGLLEPSDILVSGDFMGALSKRAQLMVLSPNIKGAPHPKLMLSTGASAIAEGLRITGNLAAVGEYVVPSEAALYNGGNAIETLRIELSPQIPGLSLEYMVSLISSGDTGWMAAGLSCGTRGQAIQGFAVRLTGTAKDLYTVRYSSGSQIVADGAFSGSRGQNQPVRQLRVVVSRR
jgi:hypothetical protein